MLEVKIEWHENYWNRLNGINGHSNWPHPVCFLVSMCCCNVNITFWYYHMVPMGFLPDIRLRMHHGTYVTHIPWCMLGSITSGFPWSRWQGKCSQHSRRMRNQRFNVSVESPIWRYQSFYISAPAYAGYYAHIFARMKLCTVYCRSLLTIVWIPTFRHM